ncbi:Ldh family oxidoreductase [Microbacterium sp. NPDC089321]|uniref:Ldh family oxidoreductase n=1 Tax=Microbacterium sp. NPDC089321 TaxID=3155183 RepID=UPI0034326DB6
MTQRLLVLVESAEADSMLESEPFDSPWSFLSVGALRAGLPPSAYDDAVALILDSAQEPLIVSYNATMGPSRAVTRWWRMNCQNVDVIAPEDHPLPPWASRALVTHYARPSDLRTVIVGRLADVASSPRHSGPADAVTLKVADVADAGAVLLEQVGVPVEDARATVSDLIDAELAGYSSHGLVRIEEYVNKLRRRVLNATPRLDVTALGSGRYILDADQALGAVTRREVVRVIEGSRDPVLTLSVRRSGHLGRLAPLAADVCELDRFLLGFVNGAGGGQKVVPFGGTERRLATNPIVFGFPFAAGPPLVIDVSTSTMSDGAVKVASSMRSPLAEGVLVDRHGASVRVPSQFAESSAASLLPLGGSAFGHKGYGLALAVEVLAGIWGGGGFSQPGRVSSGNSAVFLSASLDAMGEVRGVVQENMSRLAAYVTSARSANTVHPVRLPGADARRPHEIATVELPFALARALGL